ncbi:hypothetical protein HO133_001553 [Letharia lupina]|uniref:AB hydrolase-1 domain-containing protein n=1 Tax=Letharia lupina TaxID=560253 RepID=A0A8H6FAR3_9LECA|nr:uncharacterized protein HO133_001553 [Letharia lupina]KAF6221587.1 hypothetical protein HO133_001553 [Letharia lupina]
MAPNVKPAIVLVHGAWHVPEHYSDFIQQLQQAGFEVVCPRLPTCDETKRLTADLFSDARVVRSHVNSLIDKSREVIMLLHSLWAQATALGSQDPVQIRSKFEVHLSPYYRISHIAYISHNDKTADQIAITAMAL